MRVACAMAPADRLPVDAAALARAVRAYRKATRPAQRPLDGWIYARCEALLSGAAWACNKADRAALTASK